MNNNELSPNDVVRKTMELDFSVVDKIQQMPRSKYSKREQLHIDLFLFSCYTGGPSLSEMAMLKSDSMGIEKLTYKKNNTANTAIVPIDKRVLDIVINHESECFDEFLLPIYSYKHTTPEKQDGRLKRLSEQINMTLKKVSKQLKLKESVTFGIAKRLFIEQLIKENIRLDVIALFTGLSYPTILNYYENFNSNND